MRLKLALLALIITAGSAWGATALIGVSVTIAEAEQNAYDVIIECEYEGRTDRCDEAWEIVRECEENKLPPEECIVY